MLRRAIALLWVIAYTLVAGTAAGAAGKRDAHFYFAQITDTHFGDSDAADRAEKVTAAINRLPMRIECVVHTGDIVVNRIEDPQVVDSALKVLKTLKAPVHYVPGNHDILQGSRLPATVDAFRRSFGPLASKVEYQGVVFLMVYTEPLNGSFAVKGYDPLAWLSRALRGAGRKPVIIFQHGAAVDDFYGNAPHRYWPPDVRRRWEKLIAAGNVKAIIAGHFHRDELHWVGNVPVYVAPPVAGLFGRQAAYRIYEYRNGKLGYRTQYLK